MLFKVTSEIVLTHGGEVPRGWLFDLDWERSIRSLPSANLKLVTALSITDMAVDDITVIAE